jgi:hypothetical protein
MKHTLLALAVVLLTSIVSLAQSAIKIATFDVDATPPLASAMAYDPVKRIDELTLRSRGIVLCAVDWIGIAQ